MTLLSRRSMVAVEAVLDIAYHGGTRPVQSQDITRRQGIPRRYLEPALQRLVRAGLLRGVRGPRGGYRLARERHRVSVGDIVRLVEGDGPSLPEAGTSDLWRNVLAPLWQELQDRFGKDLNRISIQDLCLRAKDQAVPEDGAEALSYSI